MQIYKHRQIGTLIIFALGVTILLLLGIMLQVPAGPAWIITAFVLLLLIVSLFLFWSLTVEITPQMISVHLGFGTIHKEIRFEDIRAARVVKNPWYYGWGIRGVPHGWMFNVSGFGAIELEFDNNQRFRIGSDEPQQLLQAIQQQLSRRK